MPLGFQGLLEKRSFMTSPVACLTNFLKFYRIISLSSWDCTLHFTSLKLRLKSHDHLRKMQLVFTV